MSYKSIDEIQQYFAKNIFDRTNDPKKASGRALGTFIEIITYYLLKSWGLQKNISIETRLPEYANSELTHNVEFTLHKSMKVSEHKIEKSKSISTANILKEIQIDDKSNFSKASTKKLLDAKDIITIKNGTVIGTDINHIHLAYIDTENENYLYSKIKKQPYAMFECKRVGKEGDSKGPQTIEKAKQGAYVAKAVSSLQKVRSPDGRLQGLIIDEKGNFIIDDYYVLLEKIIDGKLKHKVDNVILTVGVVSNHGNWFTAENQNKELKVLGQSYDWLLFLTDEGLSCFVQDFLQLKNCKTAFTHSYSINPVTHKKNENCFTKSYISYEADKELTKYFKDDNSKITDWFNILSPAGKDLSVLRSHLEKLDKLEAL